MKVKTAFKDIFDNIANLLKSRPLAVFSVLAFVFSAMRLCFPMEPLFVMCLVVSCFLLFLRLTGRINTLITVFICISLCLGITSATVKTESNTRLVNNFSGDFARVEGYVSSIPQENIYNIEFFFKCNSIKGNRNTCEDIEILVRLNDGEVVPKYGERLTFNCVLTGIEEANKRLAKNYLSKDVALAASDVVLLSRAEPVFPQSIIASAQAYIFDIANEFLNGDARELFKALLAGDRSGFSDKLTRNLNVSGLSHITCVSGLHVSLLGMAIYNLFKRKNKYLSAVAGLIGVWFFAVLTGMSPSVVRAAIMFTSYMIAKVALTENDSLTALSLSAMLLTLANPYVIFDWGFILSFLSVLGILLLSNTFKRMLSFLPEFVADSISVTVSAQLMTLPAVINMFGYLSTYSIFANLVLSTVFLIILYLSFIFLFAAKIPLINEIFAVVCNFFLDMIAVVANFFADLPSGITYMNYFDVFEIVVYYILIILFIFRKKLSEYVIAGAMIFCSLILVAAALFSSGSVYTYDLSENSYILCADEKNVLLARDNLMLINSSLEELGEIYIEDIVVAGDVNSQLNGLIEIGQKVGTVHISEEYVNSDFCAIAYRMGKEVEFFSPDTEIEAYLSALQK